MCYLLDGRKYFVRPSICGCFRVIVKYANYLFFINPVLLFLNRLLMQKRAGSCSFKFINVFWALKLVSKNLYFGL